MTRLLIHTCCGPCSIYPVQQLQNEDIRLRGYFYPHNIHPLIECQKREQTLKDYAGSIDLKVIFPQTYELQAFLQKIVFREKERCTICYHERMRATAQVAKRGKFDGFTSTLLYSKFQNHALIRSVGESVAEDQNIPFVYRDFRSGWKEGIDRSKAMGMYRQQYCGCIYSEAERYGRLKRCIK